MKTLFILSVLSKISLILGIVATICFLTIVVYRKFALPRAYKAIHTMRKEYIFLFFAMVLFFILYFILENHVL